MTLRDAEGREFDVIPFSSSVSLARDYGYLIVRTKARRNIEMLLEFTLGIGSNLVTDLIKHGGKRFLDNTRLGAGLKERLGLLDSTTEDEFKRVLLETYATYFSRYPERQFQVFYDFFASKEVSKRLFSFVFDLQPIDYSELENALQTRMGKDWILFRILERDNLTVRKIIDDFIDCYTEAEKKSVGVGFLLTLREIRQSEQRIVEKTADELKDTSEKIITSVVGSFSAQLAALENELRQMGIDSKNVQALHSLGRDAKRIEYALHELQVHLQAIMATAENMSFDAKSTRRVPEKIKEQAKEVSRLSLMLYYSILNVMGYAEIAGYRFERVNFGTILRDIAKIYEPLAQHKNLVIVLRPQQKRFPYLELSWPIRLAINNLMNNAVKYSFRGTPTQARQITVSGERAGHFYKLSIKNYGVAIPPDEYEKIFEDGYRSTATRSQFVSGMGRGLYVARVIVERHHGKIRAFSEQDGDGHSTTVEIYLPYRQPT